MKLSEFEHAIRAAGAILSTDTLLVIGSQAIHASLDQPFDEAMRSIEVDIAVLSGNYELSADVIDGSIGELSMFQETYGYYAQGVTPNTASLPQGWRKRLIPFSSKATQGVTAFCLEPHDLWLSKAIAGRDKDREFCSAMVENHLVDQAELEKRLKKVPELDTERKLIVLTIIKSIE